MAATPQLARQGIESPKGLLPESAVIGISREEIKSLVAAVDYSDALSITAGEQDVRKAARAARRFGFGAVVAFPQYLGILVDELQGLRFLEVNEDGGGRVRHPPHAPLHGPLEQETGGKDFIIIHEIPFMVNKAGLIMRIADLVKERKIEGIADLRDESFQRRLTPFRFCQ